MRAGILVTTSGLTGGQGKYSVPQGLYSYDQSHCDVRPLSYFFLLIQDKFDASLDMKNILISADLSTFLLSTATIGFYPGFTSAAQFQDKQV